MKCFDLCLSWIHMYKGMMLLLTFDHVNMSQILKCLQWSFQLSLFYYMPSQHFLIGFFLYLTSLTLCWEREDEIVSCCNNSWYIQDLFESFCKWHIFSDWLSQKLIFSKYSPLDRTNHSIFYSNIWINFHTHILGTPIRGDLQTSMHLWAYIFYQTVFFLFYNFGKREKKHDTRSGL